MKRLVRLAAACVWLLAGMSLFPAAACAQAGPTATGPGSSVTVGGGISLFQSVYGQRELGGGFVFADFAPHWRFDLEAEARVLRLHDSEETTESNYLIGPRILLRPGGLQPYAKLLVGDGHINMPFGYAHGDFLAVVPGAGVDLALNDYVNVRVVDVEYQLWQQFPYGTMRPFGVSAGLSVRLTPIVRLPKEARARH
jgi:hypothetical protein